MFNGVLLLVSSNLKASNSQAVESASSKLRGFSLLSFMRSSQSAIALMKYWMQNLSWAGGGRPW